MNDVEITAAERVPSPRNETSQRERGRTRLYNTYATHHAGRSDGKAASWAFRRDILRHLPADHEATLLDIGCGQGDLVMQCQRHGYKKATGVDVSDEQVAIAHARGIAAVNRSNAVDALRAASAAGGLDVVIATDVFEHLTKDEVLDMLDSIHGALRPGGKLIVRTPNAANPFFGYYQYGDFTHETVFTGRSLSQAARTAGFSSVSVFPLPPVAHNLVSGVRHALWTVLSGLRRVMLAVETGKLRGHVVTLNMMVVATR